MYSRPRIRLTKFPEDKTCAVTTSWDDNDKSNVEVLKILESFRMKGTFYIDPGNTDYKNRGLSNKELRALAQKQEVGSHTWSHVNVTRCPRKRLLYEYMRSKTHIEEIIRKPVVGLAYPYGAHSSPSWKIARHCGYLFARTTDEGVTGFPPRNPFLWGVSVYALDRLQLWPTLISKRTLLTAVGRLYLTNLALDWRRLARRLFQRSVMTRGVWHIFGHAQDVVRPKLHDGLLEVFKLVARRQDVWYATNQMLFLNEIIKKATRVGQYHESNESTFEIQVSSQAKQWTRTNPIPLAIDLPESWAHAEISITPSNRGKIKISGNGHRRFVSIFDSAALITVRN